MSNFKTVIFEATIGAGKSTSSKELADILGNDTLYYSEPTNENNENPYLEKYYKDSARWAYTMQTHLLAKRFKAHMNAQWWVMNGKGHAILDRSYFGDVSFAYLQKEFGYLSSEEFETYKALYQEMTSFVLYPNICVYLDCPVDVTIERIKKRSRNCECNIPRAYLESLEINIKKMLFNLSKKGTEIIELDWSENLDSEELRKPKLIELANKINSTVTLREFVEDDYTSRKT